MLVYQRVASEAQGHLGGVGHDARFVQRGLTIHQQRITWRMGLWSIILPESWDDCWIFDNIPNVQGELCNHIIMDYVGIIVKTYWIIVENEWLSSDKLFLRSLWDRIQ
jgi:hypothetical protein